MAAWKAALSWFIRKLLFKYGGRPLVLKSPAHAGRIRLLLDCSPTPGSCPLVRVSVSRAPVLGTGLPTFPSIGEDTAKPAGATVATLLGTLVTDPDGASVAQGLALTGVIGAANGTWQYSLTASKQWLAIGNVLDDSALLLRSVDKLRFLPNGTPSRPPSR